MDYVVIDILKEGFTIAHPPTHTGFSFFEALGLSVTADTRHPNMQAKRVSSKFEEGGVPLGTSSSGPPTTLKALTMLVGWLVREKLVVEGHRHFRIMT